ncbi:hypothetical protein BY458DRAFT_517956 [Sporodiniella umbellata]|nr:hypothetical protein BY458DRAFT_517956 [Sporodiniella umbellata]
MLPSSLLTKWFNKLITVITHQVNFALVLLSHFNLFSFEKKIGLFLPYFQETIKVIQ